MQEKNLLLVEAGGYEISCVEIMMAQINIILLGLPFSLPYDHEHDVVRWQCFFTGFRAPFSPKGRSIYSLGAARALEKTITIVVSTGIVLFSQEYIHSDSIRTRSGFVVTFCSL